MKEKRRGNSIQLWCKTLEYAYVDEVVYRASWLVDCWEGSDQEDSTYGNGGHGKRHHPTRGTLRGRRGRRGGAAQTPRKLLFQFCPNSEAIERNASKLDASFDRSRPTRNTRKARRSEAFLASQCLKVSEMYSDRHMKRNNNMAASISESDLSKTKLDESRKSRRKGKKDLGIYSKTDRIDPVTRNGNNMKLRNPSTTFIHDEAIVHPDGSVPAILTLSKRSPNDSKVNLTATYLDEEFPLTLQETRISRIESSTPLRGGFVSSHNLIVSKGVNTDTTASGTSNTSISTLLGTMSNTSFSSSLVSDKQLTSQQISFAKRNGWQARAMDESETEAWPLSGTPEKRPKHGNRSILPLFEQGLQSLRQPRNKTHKKGDSG